MFLEALVESSLQINLALLQVDIYSDLFKKYFKFNKCLSNQRLIKIQFIMLSPNQSKNSLLKNNFIKIGHYYGINYWGKYSYTKFTVSP